MYKWLFLSWLCQHSSDPLRAVMTPFRAATALILLCSVTATVTAEAAAKAQVDVDDNAAVASNNDTVVATVTSIAPEKKMRAKAMMSREKEQMKKLMLDKGKMLDQEEERVPLSADDAKKLRRDLQVGAGAGGGHGQQHHHHHHPAPPYPSPQYVKPQKPQRGKKANGDMIDFSNAVLDPETGKLCVTRFEQFDTLDKDPILECFHRQVRQCHLTYITQYQPNQEEVCEENFEKTCQITFKKQAYNETVRKCYRPLERFCGQEQEQQYPQPLYSNNGNAVDNDDSGDEDEDGEENCRTYFESTCTTRYIQKNPGQFVGDTKCEKLPVRLCGTSDCKVRPGAEECKDQVVGAVVDIPEESCDLNPQKVCKLQTRLVPRLTPYQECKAQPREVCQMRFTPSRNVKKPLTIKYCLNDGAEEEEPEEFEAPSYSAPNVPPSSFGAPQASSQSASYAPPPPPSSGGIYSPPAGGSPSYTDSGASYDVPSPDSASYSPPLPVSSAPSSAYGTPVSVYAPTPVPVAYTPAPPSVTYYRPVNAGSPAAAAPPQTSSNYYANPNAAYG